MSSLATLRPLKIKVFVRMYFLSLLVHGELAKDILSLGPIQIFPLVAREMEASGVKYQFLNIPVISGVAKLVDALRP